MVLYNKGELKFDLTKSNGYHLRVKAEYEEAPGVPRTMTLVTNVTCYPDLSEGVSLKKVFSITTPYGITLFDEGFLLSSGILNAEEREEYIKAVEKLPQKPKAVAVMFSSGSDSKIVIPLMDTKVDVIVPKKITEKEGKKDFKAYETPTQSMELLFKPIVEEVFDSKVNYVLSRLKKKLSTYISQFNVNSA
jgi:hypothetical protein